MAKRVNKTKRRKELYNEALQYFRAHPDVFVEECLEIGLTLYQKVLMRAFFKYDFNIWVLCRGTGFWKQAPQDSDVLLQNWAISVKI